MKKTLTFLTLAIFSFGLLAFDAEAKRMGGGKNLGTQRQSVNQQQAAPKPQQAPAATPAAASGGSKWGGALAGLAAGGLLAALFMGGAFENINMMDIVTMLLLIGAVFFIIRMLRKPKVEQSSSMQYSGINTNTRENFNTPAFTPPAAATVADSQTAYRQPNIPADFKVEPFLRHAKASFMRLQAAHDHGDINEIRDYTTPEMLTEISAQINERGDAQQTTEIMFIDANLLEVETAGDLAIASVRFTGQLKDSPNGEPEAFDETWHVQKNLKDPDATWLLAGIQQAS
ncbi:putative lipid-binding transport protein (Tim44 family) [Nitrosomonas ureae]|uniref:Tim44 domain-containing protein n=1 Tax=Nitrosomonas ureae TaxID=44577 RepID=UPI000D75B30F|nr:Tim44-like domain-containing protein [Nitrosomonas ureae]PXX18346.1 putative lipid-binding transport protein (Tim44 family) [Nitrosomonas ureae]